MEKQYKGYLASHFFNRGGYLMTEELADRLIEEFPEIDWYIPHRNADINDKKGNDALITDVAIADADMDRLVDTDILVACLDGVEIDSGVAGEVMALGMLNRTQSGTRSIVGFTTDMRRNRADFDLIHRLVSSSLKHTDKTKEILENHKENFLYRNLLITGEVRKWGTLIDGYATDDDYIDKVIKAVREEIKI